MFLPVEIENEHFSVIPVLLLITMNMLEYNINTITIKNFFPNQFTIL